MVTLSDTGAITAPATGSVIPFLWADQASFPSATTYHGAIAHSHADGAMFFAHSGSWVQLAKSSEVSVSSRTTHQATTGNLSNNAAAYPDISGGYKSYMLLKIQTSNAAWVRVYTSKAARSADTTRSIDVDPVPGSGVIAEVITTGNQTQVLTPATIGFNDESTPVGEFYLAVTNRSGTSTAITVTLRPPQVRSMMREYIVTCKTKEDLESLYEDMETPGGSLYIPDREVELVHRRPISRNTHYMLTDEEAEEIRNDERVLAVGLTLEERGNNQTNVYHRRR